MVTSKDELIFAYTHVTHPMLKTQTLIDLTVNHEDYLQAKHLYLDSLYTLKSRLNAGQFRLCH